MSFNLAIVEGRIGKDVESRATSSGKKVVNFSLASDFGYGDNKSTLWDNVVCWGPQADFAEKHLKKGSGVRVVGERRSRSWDDKESGQKKTMVEIHATTVDFAGSKPEASPENGRSRTSSAPAARTAAKPEPRAAASDPFDDEPF